MKKKIFVFSISISIIFASSQIHSCQCNPCSDDDFTSQSFMFTKPVSFTLPAKNSAWHNVMHERHGDTLAAIQIIGLYQQSMSHPETARYFLFDHKSCLTVAGDNHKNSNNRDIRAEWLGLPSDFAGGFSIDPKQTQMGFFIEYNQRLKKFLDSSFFKNYWISISAPIVAVENDLNLKQFDIQNPNTSGDGPQDILEALCQDNWLYGKICKCSRSDFQLSYLKIKFGSTYMSEDHFQIAYYSQFLLSTAPRDCGKYMFDAIVGTNGHHGLGAGVNFQFPINRSSEPYSVCIFADLEHIFLFRRKQVRQLDIKGKPWSRYMLFNQKDRGPDLKLHGVNILTREVTTRPYSVADFTFGLRIRTTSFEIETGYGIWGRGDEKLELVCPFPEIYGIAGTPDGNNPTTASESTIKEQKENDEEFIPVLESDLCVFFRDKSAINHRVHLAISGIKKGNKVDGTFGAGVFYEIPQRNSALKVWGLWGKIAASF